MILLMFFIQQEHNELIQSILKINLNNCEVISDDKIKSHI